jgi:hypothetical protein
LFCNIGVWTQGIELALPLELWATRPTHVSFVFF